ncbi:hypothetical protein GCM10010967_45010 [Dyadobacter beijingensis]|uniref:Secretion system C-terminal sorting domain-containing protein n=2 Tax=Dyadobacter beijingensis TaxID=365489 RepID=A0ABQ2IBG2_9BACT|nr:hypothetical protein GCM10010967_45010 [Dyadobacter beijingensis]
MLLLSRMGFAQTSVTSNLPIVVINTSGATIPDIDKIPATMKITAAGGGGLHTFDANSPSNVFQFEHTIGIELRGNTSIYWPKKSYSVETTNATGGGEDVSVLGMPAESDWVLNACYGDKSFIRDVFAHEMYTRTGRYSPKTRYVEVFLQETGGMTYQGVYILMEKVKRASSRINIKKLAESDTDPAKITGGYLLQVSEDEDMKWTSQYAGNDAPAQPKPFFHVEYPKLHKYTNTAVRDMQFNYIKGRIDNFENVLAGANYADENIGYRPLLDEDSFIDYLLLQEITKNSDNWRASTFFYKQRDDEGGQIAMGAPWDFDKSMGNQQWCYELSVLPTGSWAWQFNNYCPDRPPMTVFWPARLLTDCYFKNKLIVRYMQLRQTQWSNQSISSFIDQKQAELIGQNAMQRNFSRWNILETDVMFNQHYPLPGNTYAKEVQYLKTWLVDHLNWMDANIASISTVDCGPLPVTFKSFEVKPAEQSAVRVSWTTSEELRNDHFEVERSADARRFESLGMVKGEGNSSVEQRYDFLDVAPLPGTSYYRIRQVDTDGTASFSSVKWLTLPGAMAVVFPNPAQDQIVVKNIQVGSILLITDSRGQIVKRATSDGKQARLATGSLHSGSYVLTVTTPDGKVDLQKHFIINR